MNNRPVDCVVTEFLTGVLADAAVSVPKLEAMARAAGLLGDRQGITHAKPFKRVKKALGIQSVRDGFGAGTWLWQLPTVLPATSTDHRSAVSVTVGVAHAEVQQEAPLEQAPATAPVAHRVPTEWVTGVASLEQHRPLADVPRHRWRQFVDDCNRFLSSSQAERAAALGWDATALFGCRRNHPLLHLGSAGLIWAVNGGKVAELHRGWAVIDVPVNRSQRIFYRRDVDAAKVTLPWTERRKGRVVEGEG